MSSVIPTLPICDCCKKSMPYSLAAAGFLCRNCGIYVPETKVVNGKVVEHPQPRPNPVKLQRHHHTWLYDPDRDELVCPRCDFGHAYQDIMMFIGSKYYTPETWLTEASKFGASLCVSWFPDFIVLGKSRCFVAYCEPVSIDAQIALRNAGKSMRDEQPQRNHIFAWFTVKQSQLILNDSEPLRKELQAQGITKVYWSDAKRDPIRLGGKRRLNACYITSNIGMERMFALPKGFEGAVSDVKPSIAYVGRYFRGYRYVDGDKLLRGG